MASSEIPCIQLAPQQGEHGFDTKYMGFPGVSDVKESACSVGDQGLIPGSGRSPGEGNGKPLQYFCLENPADRGAWQVAAYGVAKSWTQLSYFTFFFTVYIINN